MDTLLASLSLPQGVPLCSPNGAYHLVVQADGNLVLYRSSHFHPDNALWASQTQGRGSGPFRLDLQRDGNLVLYDGANNPTWATQTHGAAGSGHLDQLKLQDDRNLVLYRNGKARWSSGTHLLQ
jgi:hypothetical protein